MNIARAGQWGEVYLEGTRPRGFSLFLRIALVGFIAASLAACCTARKITAEYQQVRSTLNGRDVVVSFFNNVPKVQQTALDLCWAASLEQALRFQGVDANQNLIAEKVYPEAEANRTITMFWWHQQLLLTEERLLDGSEVWARSDLDGGLEGPILSSDTFVRKIAFELSHNRIPLVGITYRGGGHIVSVIGAAFPVAAKRLTTDQIVGFLIYDPLDGKTHLESTEELFRHLEALVYVTTYGSTTGAVFGNYCSAKLW